MIPWNPEALELFNRHGENHRGALLALGADPDEVFSDWKALIESRAAAAGEREVEPGRVETELIPLLKSSQACPAPDAPPAVPPSPPRDPSPRAPSTLQKWFGRSTAVMLWILGVFLPLGVLVFELLAGVCAEILFDPIPTWGHALLIALVPAANALALAMGSRERVRAAGTLFRWIGRLNGMAIGIAAFYALQFILVTPFAVMAIIYFGIGFIPLSPLLAFISALAIRSRLRRARFLTEAPPPAAWWRTALPAFLLLFLLAVPRLVVPRYAPQVSDPDPAVRARATAVLRVLGSRDVLLRRCYRTQEPMDFFTLVLGGSFRGGRPASRADAQTAFYRVTGTPYSAVPPPRLKGLRGQDLIDSDWWDPALGGDQVAARIKGLTLSQSRLDGRIDSASGTAYLEWTLEFHNASPAEREARALIELPPGGAVSRVTLWINGEPCEAAFGGRSQTRQAYQQVAVRQRRDPVLVTTAGPDRILMQCFPVPVDGSMKTRIGITVPLLVPDAQKAEAALRLPRFVEQNFSAAPEVQTSVWLESDQPPLEVKGGTNGFLVLNGSPYSIRGKAPADSAASAPFLLLPLASPPPRVLSRDARLGANEAILQTLDLPEDPAGFPDALAIVIDGSARMDAHHAHMTKCLFDFLPPETRVRTWIAYDAPKTVDGKPPFHIRYAGGCDNGPALVQAAEWAAENGNAPILWLHAAQPLDSPELEALRQIADFSRGRLVIHSHQYGPGANRIAEQLADLRLIRPLPVLDDRPMEIINLLQNRSGRWHREKLAGDAIPGDVPEGSSHVARLWAAGEIARLSNPCRKTGRDEAVALARTWQLVTPVSGAVVLETAAQYKAHGLEPADPSTTPGIVPEPGTLGLLLIGAPLLLAARRRRRT